MNVQAIIEEKLNSNIPVDFLHIKNESNRHAVPADSQTHFKVVLVSSSFSGMSLIARHRLVNDLLRDELAGPIHALALHTYTPAQWRQKGKLSPASADCLGGGV